MDYVAAFTDDMRRAGVAPDGEIIADGKLRRCRIVGDSKKKKNGWYRLTIESELAFGAFGSWKYGVTKTWFSKRRADLSVENYEHIERKKREIAQAEKAMQAKAAARARAIWEQSAPVDDHIYFQRKRVNGRSCRQINGKLVIPMYSDNAGKPELCGLQFISGDGSKKFLTGAKSAGAYASISDKGSSREVILICEGFATGLSIYEATAAPVVVAFNAGNLRLVSESIRAKYPQAQIIIAGDNDQWTLKAPHPPELRGVDVSDIPGDSRYWDEWRSKGLLYNPGEEKARVAAEAIKGRFCVPPFAPNDALKPTDFNDLHLRAGIEAVRAALIGDPVHIVRACSPDSMPDIVINEPPPAPPADIEAWKHMLIPGKQVCEGFPHPFDAKSKMNTYLFLRYDQVLSGLLIYNEFADQITVVKCPPWENPATFAPRSICDEDYFMYAAYLERLQMRIGKDTASDAAIKAAKENRINPPKEYFERLEWDGMRRLDNWLTYYLGADSQPPEYLALVGSKWLIAAVTRIYKPGAKFDSALILEGEQGIGKSTALRILATFNGENYFLDSASDIKNKDTLMMLQGKIIIEMAELASFRKAENQEIKTFIDRQIDEYRPPYGRMAIKRPRYFVFGGTTNETDDGYLTDPTGNRRYWPVLCKSIDLDALERDKAQLWAEAVYRYKQGERIWLTKDEALLSKAEQYKRQIEDAWQENIEKFTRNLWEISIEEICKALELKPKDITNFTKSRIKNTLRHLGWYETRRANVGRVWRLRGAPNAVDLLENVEDSERVLDTVA